jgi:hypothetical protein
MLSNLLLYSVILLLAARGAKSVVRVDPGTCASIVPEINSAVQEAVNIATFAYQRTIGIRDHTLSYPDEVATLDTFQAYFGRTEADNVVGTGNLLVGQSFILYGYAAKKL